MTPPHRRTVATLAVVAFVLAVAVVAVGPAGAAQPTGSLSKSTYHVIRGQSVDIGVSHSAPATLTVGSAAVGYALQVDVGGSGSSTVTIHTYGSTSANPNDYVDGGSATLLDPASGGLGTSLAPGRYPLNLTVDNVTQDLGTLVIEPRPPATMTAMVAPGSVDTTAANAGTVLDGATPRHTVAKGDLAVLRFNLTGLGAAVDPAHLAGGPAGNGIDVHFEDTSPPPNRPAHSFEASDSSAVTTYWNTETAQLVVVWDTADVALRNGRHTYDVSLSIDGQYNHLLTGTETATNGTITVVAPMVDLDLPTHVRVFPWDSPTLSVTGTTTLAPGTDLQVRTLGTDPRPFLRSVTGTVTTNGTFHASLDLTGLGPTPPVPLFVLGHRDETAHDLTVVGSNASFTFPNQTSETGRAVELTNVTLDAGGFLVVGHRSNGSTGPAGVSSPLDPGTAGNVTVAIDPGLNTSGYVVARAYMDSNENGTYDPGTDRPYRSNGTVVSRRAVVWVGTADTNSTVPPPTTTTTAANRSSNATTVTATPTTTISVTTQPPLTPNGAAPASTDLPLWVPALAVALAVWLAGRGR